MKKTAFIFLITILLFGMIEGLARLFSLAPRERFFIEETDRESRVWLRTNPESPWGGLPFEPSKFLAEKPADTLRIFCLGGSTTNGFPFARHSSFAKWLRVRLEHLHPSKDFEVVKMGFDAKSARPIADLCEEIVAYGPDLIVVYTGHNLSLIHI